LLLRWIDNYFLRFGLLFFLKLSLLSGLIF
jgi:hypothetical protein